MSWHDDEEDDTLKHEPKSDIKTFAAFLQHLFIQYESYVIAVLNIMTCYIDIVQPYVTCYWISFPTTVT